MFEEALDYKYVSHLHNVRPQLVPNCNLASGKSLEAALTSLPKSSLTHEKSSLGGKSKATAAGRGAAPGGAGPASRGIFFEVTPFLVNLDAF